MIFPVQTLALNISPRKSQDFLLHLQNPLALGSMQDPAQDSPGATPGAGSH